MSFSNYMSELGLNDREVADILLKHMATTDHMGIDPSTIMFDPKLLRFVDAGQSIPVISQIWSSLFYKTIFFLGHRANLFIKPQSCRFSKGMALCLSALAHLQAQAVEEEKPKIIAHSKHLYALISAKKLLSSNLWAHDSDYSIQNIPITTKTPNLVTTAFVANSFWDWWYYGNFEPCKQEFLLIVEEMLKVFPLIKYGNMGCFMYTPITRYHVHNANLLMAELLSKRFVLRKNKDDLRLIRMAVLYSSEDFKKTNSIPYAGPPTEQDKLDNYHTGFVLRSLNAIKQCVPELAHELRIQETIRKGLDLYLHTFVKENRIWRDLKGVMNAHSLAESILIDKEFHQMMENKTKEKFRDAIRMTAKELWHSKSGYFINYLKRLPMRLGSIHDRTDMIRWSQAWMFYALAKPVEESKFKFEYID